MRAKVVAVSEGETVELSKNLGATDVEVVNGRNLAVVVDETADTRTYVRRFKRSRSPKRADLELPDGAVVAQWDGNAVEYLEPQ